MSSEKIIPHQRSLPTLAHSEALKRSGVPYFRLYDLRDTWATRAAMSGIDLVTLAALLGHSRIQMVLRYAHPTEQHQTDAVKRLEQFNAAKQIAEFEGKGYRFRYSDQRRENRAGGNLLIIMEARVGIEPTHKGFADHSSRIH